jgi:hypothetical protein
MYRESIRELPKRRTVNRILNLAIPLVVLLGACNGNGESGIVKDDWRRTAPEQAPWTLEIPPGWSTSTVEFDPGPRGMVGKVISTGVATTSFHPDGKPPQPHSTGSASKELGEDGAVVLIRAMSPPKSDEVWDPPAGAELERREPSRWHEDFANPGWLSRERKLCVGSACVSVLEWHAPEASEDDIERMSLIASSIRMATE